MTQQDTLPARRMLVGAALTIPVAYAFFPQVYKHTWKPLTVVDELRYQNRMIKRGFLWFAGCGLIGATIALATRNKKFA